MCHTNIKLYQKYSPNALPTALPRKICKVGFKHCTVHRYSKSTMLHVIASCMHNNFI